MGICIICKCETDKGSWIIDPAGEEPDSFICDAHRRPVVFTRKGGYR